MRKPILLLSLSCLLGVISSCGGNGGEQNESSVFSTWTTYSTSKIIQQTYNNNNHINTGDAVKIKMMRDEYESSQLIITSEGRQSFDLIKGDLIDTTTGNTIPQENIEIYVQKYIELELNMHSSNNPLFVGGDMIPDMLLPLEYAKSSGENFTKANSNQGITIEISSYGLPAGVYKGEFTLKVGEISKQIPIEVTIWDILLEGKSTIQSCWLIYSMYMLTGEYDASEKMLDTYADFLSKYKANPYIIQEDVMNSPEALMQDVKRMWNIKNYNSITIPYDFPLTYDASTAQGDRAASYIVKLAEESTEENFYLDYALFYPSTYDEADVIAPKKAASPAFFKEGGSYQQTLEKAIRMLENKGYFATKSNEWNERVKKAIRAIPDVFTNVNLAEGWVKEYPATFCPQINVLDYKKYQELYKDYANKNVNGDFWTYTCCSPNYPYPSHHLDDDCLSMRVMGWMEKAFDINGYLFFMANMYTTEKRNNEYTTPYVIANRNDSANGDGFIMYPGRPYGSPTPFPSMRLVTYRDGLEDYDMLEVFERKIEAMKDKYGIDDLDSKEYVKDIYDTLFNNSVPTEEHAKLYEAREELAKRILNFDNEDDLFTYAKNDDGVFNLYIHTNSPTLKIQGSQVSGTLLSEARYRYIIPLNETKENISIVTDKGNVYEYANRGYKNITNFMPDYDGAKLSKNSSFVAETGRIHANIESVREETISKTIRFVPSISFEGLDLEGAKKLKFNYSNPSSIENLTFDVDLVGKSKTVTIADHFCMSGVSKSMEIDLSKVNMNLSDVKSLRFSFVNYYFDSNEEMQLFNTREIELGDIFASY